MPCIRPCLSFWWMSNKTYIVIENGGILFWEYMGLAWEKNRRFILADWNGCDIMPKMLFVSWLLSAFKQKLSKQTRKKNTIWSQGRARIRSFNQSINHTINQSGIARNFLLLKRGKAREDHTLKKCQWRSFQSFDPIAKFRNAKREPETQPYLDKNTPPP